MLAAKPVLVMGNFEALLFLLSFSPELAYDLAGPRALRRRTYGPHGRPGRENVEHRAFSEGAQRDAHREGHRLDQRGQRRRTTRPTVWVPRACCRRTI